MRTLIEGCQSYCAGRDAGLPGSFYCFPVSLFHFIVLTDNEVGYEQARSELAQTDDVRS